MVRLPLDLPKFGSHFGKIPKKIRRTEKTNGAQAPPDETVFVALERRAPTSPRGELIEPSATLPANLSGKSIARDRQQDH